MNQKKYKPHKYWTKEKVFSQAKKYKTSKNWYQKCSSSYSIAVKNDWIPELRKNNILKPIKVITKIAILTIAKKYKTKNEFRKLNKNAYNTACMRGWLKDCNQFFKKRKYPEKTFWSNQLIFNEAKKYKTWSDIQKNEKLISAIYKYQLVSKIQKLKKYKKELKWSQSNLIKESKKYKTKKEFFQKNPTALRMIYEKGFEKECFKHMNLHKKQLEKKLLLNAIKQSKSKTLMSYHFPREYALMHRKKYKLDHLFPYNSKFRLIEKKLLHPKIKYILKKNKINFLYEKKIKINNHIIIPDFIFFIKKTIYILEAKSSIHYPKIGRASISKQSKKQIHAIKVAYPHHFIKHILLSDYGNIKSENSHYIMSLESLNLFLSKGIYKKNKSKINNKTLLLLSNKIIKEYVRKFNRK